MPRPLSTTAPDWWDYTTLDPEILRDAVEKYQQLIGDVWTPLITGVFMKCKMSWHYRIPEDAAEQEHLRGLCERMLSLENHILEVCRPYLLKWQGQEENKEFALRMLSMIRFPELSLRNTSRVVPGA